jgi:hypothetical protein
VTTVLGGLSAPAGPAEPHAAGAATGAVPPAGVEQPTAVLPVASDPDAGAQAAPAVPVSPSFRDRGKLRRRLRYLRRVRELGYRDLGGLTFDLHRFGRDGAPLIQEKLAALGAVDAELRAVERALGEERAFVDLHEAGIAACPRCAALHGSEARFCPSCGIALVGPMAGVVSASPSAWRPSHPSRPLPSGAPPGRRPRPAPPRRWRALPPRCSPARCPPCRPSSRRRASPRAPSRRPSTRAQSRARVAGAARAGSRRPGRALGRRFGRRERAPASRGGRPSRRPSPAAPWPLPSRAPSAREHRRARGPTAGRSAHPELPALSRGRRARAGLVPALRRPGAHPPGPHAELEGPRPRGGRALGAPPRAPCARLRAGHGRRAGPGPGPRAGRHHDDARDDDARAGSDDARAGDHDAGSDHHDAGATHDAGPAPGAATTTPGTTTPGATTPGATTPAATTPGAAGSGTTTPGTTTPGTTTPRYDPSQGGG